MDHKKVKEALITNDKSELKQNLELDRIIVWAGKEPLYSVIEQAKDLPLHKKLTLRACKEVEYTEEAIFKTAGYSKVAKRLSDILSEKPVLDENDRILIRSSALNEVFETIQQLINLSYIADVYTTEEEKKRMTLEKMLNRYEDLSQELKDFIEHIRNLKNEKENEKFNDRIDAILKNAEKTEESLEMFKSDNVIKIAVFATKKSGKSMLVNALLGEEYAPTSLELATPNIIIYKPNKSKTIFLEYKGERKEFLNASELKTYIKSEFEKHNLKGTALDDMVIYYPEKEGINYEIWDTPGPDLAGSEHKALTERAIKETDVAIFIVDYSKYAQQSEVDILNEIRDIFTHQDKKYSLIGVINKIDLMFQDANVEHSIVKISDFMFEKFKELGFQQFMVIPTTAMMYFYLNEISKMFPEIKNQEDARKYIDNILDEKFDQLSSEMKTYLTTVLNYSNSLRNVFGREKKLTFDELIRLTNFSMVIKYITYIFENKAQVEKEYSYAKTISTTSTTIFNELNSSKVLLAEELDRIIEAIREFESETSNIGEEFSKLVGDKKSEFSKELKETKEELIKKIKLSVDDATKRKWEAIRNEFWNWFNRVVNGEEESTVFEPTLDFSDLENIISNNLETTKNDIAESVKKINLALNETISKDYEKFKQAVDSLNKELSDILCNQNEENALLEVPNIDLTLNIEVLLQQFIEQIPDVQYQKVDITGDLEMKNPIVLIGIKILKEFSKMFGKNLKIEEYRYNPQTIVEKLMAFYEQVEEQFDNYVKQIEENLTDLVNNIYKEFENVLNSQVLQIDDFYKSVSEVLKNRKQDVELEKSEREALVSLYEEILRRFEHLKKTLDFIFSD